MSTNTARESPRATVVGVVLLIFAATTITGVAFNSMPWVASLFGLLLLIVAWKLEASRIIVTIFALYGGTLLVLGIMITIAKAVVN
jgi:hypothetical protein